jgi:starch phosphorylase
MTQPAIPEPIGRLGELASNLWWSWHRPARELFRTLDYPMWKWSGHNPVRQLSAMRADRLQAAAADPGVLRLYHSVVSDFDEYMSATDTWFAARCPDLSRPVAFFSMEFAIHSSVPIYAGGLGILAGDICKEASDLGIPFVGVGLMFHCGYFHQRLTIEGWQEEVPKAFSLDTAPISRVESPSGMRALARLVIHGRTVHVGAWQMLVGRTRLLLLDTDIEGNDPRDRELSALLYIADPDLRVKQEMVLGIGGVRVLRALGISPAIWHGNEGHTAFMMVERLREHVEGGATLDDAVGKVQATTVFTTHTPVAAGHDVFPVPLVEANLSDYWEPFDGDRERLWALGALDGQPEQSLNMTALALRTASASNAVSVLHRRVAQRMWHPLWPQSSEEEVPIRGITNGIHLPTWIAPEIAALFDRYLGDDWVERQDDPAVWQRVFDIPDEHLWATHQLLKRKLLFTIIDRLQEMWASGDIAIEQIPAMGSLLHPRVLTVGFVRRFTEYKRPALILEDIERLRRIVTDKWRPVQVIFAGKSHPSDFPSKHVLHEVYSLTKDRRFQGRVAFVLDHDMHVSHYLAQGVDVWLNNPRRLREACGTSGMKAGLNGIPHLSVRDGWWHEGYDTASGWAIGAGPYVSYNTGVEDKADAESLYRLLEEEVLPLYYDRDRAGVPHGWMRVAKEAMRTVGPRFCARRMLKEYVDQLYLPTSPCPTQERTPRHEASGG